MLKLFSEYEKLFICHESESFGVVERNKGRKFGIHSGQSSNNRSAHHKNLQTLINKGFIRYKSGIDFSREFGVFSLLKHMVGYGHSVKASEIPLVNLLDNSVMCSSVSLSITDFAPKPCFKAISAGHIKCSTLASYRNQERNIDRNFGVEFALISLLKSLEKPIKLKGKWLNSPYKQSHLMRSV